MKNLKYTVVRDQSQYVAYCGILEELVLTSESKH